MGIFLMVDHGYVSMADHGLCSYHRPQVHSYGAESIFGQNVEDAIWNAMSEALHKTEFDF